MVLNLGIGVKMRGHLRANVPREGELGMPNLYTVTIFGNELDWTVSTTVLVLMLAQLALVAVALVVFILLVVRRVAPHGKQNILVTHAAKQAEQERTLVGITLDTVVVQREFKVGDLFNSDGLVVTANYSGEPTSQTVQDFTVEAPDMSVEGKPNVVVRYGGFTAIYSVSIVRASERVPVGITLDTAAVRRAFTVGETFVSDGLVVSMDYSEEPYSEQVQDFTVEAPDMTTEGTPEVLVRCNGFVASYPISVEAPAPAPRTLTHIELDLSVVKTDFIVGEAFERDGLVVVACYDAAPFEEHVEDFTVEAPDLTSEGMKNVVVHYGGFTQTYPIFVTEGRALTGITLDISAVRRTFTVGEAFNCAGLAVTAEYDAQPYSEQVQDYEIAVPDVSEEGEKEVVVSYLGKSASYTVTFSKPAEEPVPVETEPSEDEEEVAEAGVLRYDKSFTARLIQSSDETKSWYTILKNELLSYQKVKDRMSWKRESYRRGREPVAKFGFRGKVLCLFLPLDPAEYAESKYKVEDVSMNKSYEDTPCMYRIKNDRRVKRACELIAVVMERLGAVKTDRLAEDYYVPYEGIYELVNKGLAKRIFVNGENFGAMGQTAEPVALEEAAVTAEPTPAPVIPVIYPEEESVEGGTLRYDKSFKAKLIQSDDEIKRFYSVVKNELLAYKKVKDRLSWKRETYKAAGACVARLSYRGNTLCIYLPLNAADFEGTRYKVEDVSENKSYVDTPCMFRIKNEKRLRLAAELIAMVMEERGIPRTDRPEEDYYEPYVDVVKLIEMGLVRREVKSKEDESVFNRGE